MAIEQGFNRRLSRGAHHINSFSLLPAHTQYCRFTFVPINYLHLIGVRVRNVNVDGDGFCYHVVISCCRVTLDSPNKSPYRFRTSSKDSRQVGEKIVHSYI
jgi:hypothetical protein